MGFYNRKTITIHASFTFQRALITVSSAEINKVGTLSDMMYDIGGESETVLASHANGWLLLARHSLERTGETIATDCHE